MKKTTLNSFFVLYKEYSIYYSWLYLFFKRDKLI